MTTAISLSQFEQAIRKGGTILGYQDKDHIAVRGTGSGLKGRIIRWRIHSRQKQKCYSGSGELIRLHYARQARTCLLDALRTEYGKDIAGELDARFRIRLAPEELSAQRVREILAAGRKRRVENNMSVYLRYVSENNCSEMRKLLAWQAMMEKTDNHQKSIDLATLAECTRRHERMLKNAVHASLVRYAARLTDPERQFLGQCLTHPSIAMLPSSEWEKAATLITESYLVHGQPIGDSTGPLAVYRSFGMEPVSDSIDDQNLVPVLYRDLCRFQENVDGMRAAPEGNMTAFERRIFRHITDSNWTGGLRLEWEYESYILRMAAHIQEIAEYAAENDLSLKPRDVWRMVAGMDPPGEVEQHNFARFLIDAGKQQEYRGLEEYRLSIAANLSGRQRQIFRRLTHNRLIRELKNSRDRKDWIDLIHRHIRDLEALPNRFDRKDVWQAIRKTPMPENMEEKDFFIWLIQKSRPADPEDGQRSSGPQSGQAPGPQTDPGVDLPDVPEILKYMNSVLRGMFLTNDSRKSVMDMLHTILDRIEQPPDENIRPKTHYSLGTMWIQSRGHNLSYQATDEWTDKYDPHFYNSLRYWGLLGEYAKKMGHQLYFKYRLRGVDWLVREEVDWESAKLNARGAEIATYLNGLYQTIIFSNNTDRFNIEVLLLPLIEDPRLAKMNRHVRYK